MADLPECPDDVSVMVRLGRLPSWLLGDPRRGHPHELKRRRVPGAATNDCRAGNSPHGACPGRRCLAGRSLAGALVVFSEWPDRRAVFARRPGWRLRSHSRPCTWASSGLDAIFRSITNPSRRARDGSPRPCGSGRDCPAEGSIRSSRSVFVARDPGQPRRWCSSRRPPVTEAAARRSSCTPPSSSGSSRARRRSGAPAGARPGDVHSDSRRADDAANRSKRVESDPNSSRTGDPDATRAVARPRRKKISQTTRLRHSPCQIRQLAAAERHMVCSARAREEATVSNESGPAPGISNARLRMRDRLLPRAGDETVSCATSRKRATSATCTAIVAITRSSRSVVPAPRRPR